MTARPCDLIVSLSANSTSSDGVARLSALPGVQRVHLDDHRTWLLVSFDRGTIGEDAILAEVSALGFRVVSVSCYE